MSYDVSGLEIKQHVQAFPFGAGKVLVDMYRAGGLAEVAAHRETASVCLLNVVSYGLGMALEDQPDNVVASVSGPQTIDGAFEALADIVDGQAGELKQSLSTLLLRLVAKRILDWFLTGE